VSCRHPRPARPRYWPRATQGRAQMFSRLTAIAFAANLQQPGRWRGHGRHRRDHRNLGTGPAGPQGRKLISPSVYLKGRAHGRTETLPVSPKLTRWRVAPPAGSRRGILRVSAEGAGVAKQKPRHRGAGLGGSIVCVAITGPAVPSETQQAHHPNAQPLRWLRAARRTPHEKAPLRRG
jgi:hypothetical protein